MSLTGKIHTIFCVIAMVTAVILFALIGAQDSSMVVIVKDGKAALYCHMQDGWRQIPAEKIEAFDGARWVFTNGSASSCKFMEANQ